MNNITTTNKRKFDFYNNNFTHTNMDLNDIIQQLEQIKIQNNELKNELSSLKTDVNNMKQPNENKDSQKNEKKKTGPKTPGGSTYNQFVKQTMKTYTDNNYFNENNIIGVEKLRFCAKLWNDQKKLHGIK